MLAGLALLAARAAWALQPADVIVSDGGSAELARKVSAELIDLGLVVADPRALKSGMSAGEALDGGNARALIRIVSEEQVELYLGGDEPGASTVLALQRGGGEGDAFALRVAEELRARLADVGPFEPAPQPAPESEHSASSTASASSNAPTSIESLTPDAPPRAPMTSRNDAASLWLCAGVGGVLALGGVGPLLEGAVGTRLELGDLDLGLSALVPLISQDVSASEGEAEVHFGALRAELGWTEHLSTRWRLRGGAGAGLLLLAMRGEPEGAFVGRNDRLISGLYYVHGGASWSLGESLRVGAGLALGLTGPRPVLRFDERYVASFGPTFGALVLEGQIGWSLATKAAP